MIIILLVQLSINRETIKPPRISGYKSINKPLNTLRNTINNTRYIVNYLANSSLT